MRRHTETHSARFCLSFLGLHEKFLAESSPSQRVDLCLNLCEACGEHFQERGYAVGGGEKGAVAMGDSGDPDFDFVVRAVEALHAALDSDLPDFFRLVQEHELNQMVLTLFSLLWPRPDTSVGFLEVRAVESV